MKRTPMYQELANATLANTKLGAAHQPYVPYNDNALAINELRAMTDRLAQEQIVNKSTQAQVFATAAQTGVPPQTVQSMVDHAERERRLLEAMGNQFRTAQEAQVTANQRNTELVIEAVGKVLWHTKNIWIPWLMCTRT